MVQDGGGFERVPRVNKCEVVGQEYGMGMSFGCSVFVRVVRS